MTQHSPLRIDFALSTPWVQPSRPMHLDGLIAFALVESEIEAKSFVDFGMTLSALPLDCERIEGEWCWKASYISAIGQKGLRQRWLTRKFWHEGYTEQYARGRIRLVATNKPEIKGAEAFGGKIDTVRGHTKNSAIHYPVALVPAAVGFCVGHGERIEALLRRFVTHLGKRSRLDHGRIDSITVTEDSRAEELWSRRNLPWPQEGYVLTEGSIRPPYWHATDLRQVYVPEGWQFAI